MNDRLGQRRLMGFVLLVGCLSGLPMVVHAASLTDTHVTVDDKVTARVAGPPGNARTVSDADAVAADSVAKGPTTVNPSVASSPVVDATETTQGAAVPAPEGTVSPAGGAAPQEPSPSDHLPYWQSLLDLRRLGSVLPMAATMTLVGVMPALVLLTTSYVRISIVLAVLRQALGAQQLMPAQVTVALSLFCTSLVMWPTWSVVNSRVVQPWCATGELPPWPELTQQTLQPIRGFMAGQIESHENWDDVHLFMKHAHVGSAYPATFDEVPLRVLFPAYLLSELKTAFLIGFQIYLPFLVIDLVTAALTTSMGMFMLAPNTIAFPLKLLLFVSVDGWRLIVDMLMQSFST